MKRLIISVLILICFAFATGQIIIRPYADVASSTLSTGLLAFWKMAETSGTRYDETANNEDLSDNNSVSYATGKVGNAADFEASNNEYLSKTDDAVLSFAATEDFTLGFYLKPESVPSSGNTFYVLGKSGEYSSEYFVSIYNNFVNSVIEFTVWDGGANTSIVSSTTALSAGTWSCCIVWHNSMTDSIYVQINDGNPIRASTGGDAPIDSDGNFVVGGWLYVGTLYYPYDGLIDCIRVWRRCPVKTNAYSMADSIYNGGSGWEP